MGCIGSGDSRQYLRPVRELNKRTNCRSGGHRSGERNASRAATGSNSDDSRVCRTHGWRGRWYPAHRRRRVHHGRTKIIKVEFRDCSGRPRIPDQIKCSSRASINCVHVGIWNGSPRDVIAVHPCQSTASRRGRSVVTRCAGSSQCSEMRIVRNCLNDAPPNIGGIGGSAEMDGCAYRKRVRGSKASHHIRRPRAGGDGYCVRSKSAACCR